MEEHHQFSGPVQDVLTAMIALMESGRVKRNFLNLGYFGDTVHLTADILVTTGKPADASELEAVVGGSVPVMVGVNETTIESRGRFVVPARYQDALRKAYGDRPEFVVLLYAANHELVLAPSKVYGGRALDVLKGTFQPNQPDLINTVYMDAQGRVNLGVRTASMLGTNKLQVLGKGDPYLILHYQPEEPTRP